MKSKNTERPFDLIVFGASGFTGRLIAETLQNGAGDGLKWALAGRSLAKLSEVRALIGAPDSLPLITADANDSVSMTQLAGQTRVLISTVGPYQLHGEKLVLACAAAGTDYVDLCGEPGWMQQMIPRLAAPAQASGARIVFSCGFDSIPFELGVLFLQDEALRRFGKPLQRVRGRVRVMKGGMSGGTVASALATFEQIGRNPSLQRLLADPFALTPGFCGPEQPEGDSATYDLPAGSWTGPFIMAPINTKNVHRSNALLGHPWGQDFEYDERMLTGDGPRGEKRARAMARNARIQNVLLGFGPARALLRRFFLPKPGQGPSLQQREAGRYEILFSGETADRQALNASVCGDRDPGYGSTSKMIVQAAICLAKECSSAVTAGGVWTPGAAMGMTLVQRLQAHAGLRFELGN